MPQVWNRDVCQHKAWKTFTLWPSQFRETEKLDKPSEDWAQGAPSFSGQLWPDLGSQLCSTAQNSSGCDTQSGIGEAQAESASQNSACAGLGHVWSRRWRGYGIRLSNAAGYRRMRRQCSCGTVAVSAHGHDAVVDRRRDGESLCHGQGRHVERNFKRTPQQGKLRGVEFPHIYIYSRNKSMQSNTERVIRRNNLECLCLCFVAGTWGASCHRQAEVSIAHVVKWDFSWVSWGVGEGDPTETSTAWSQSCRYLSHHVRLRNAALTGEVQGLQNAMAKAAQHSALPNLVLKCFHSAF